MERIGTPKKVLLLCVSLLTGCVTTDPYTGEQKISHATTSATQGALAGAAVGAAYAGITMLGKNENNRVDPRVAVLVGAGIGIVVGLINGAKVDRQEAMLREELEKNGVSVTRRGDNIVLNMGKALQFASGATRVTPEGRRVLNSVAIVLKEFDGSIVDVLGFTDDRGAEATNQKISENRAFNVAKVLVDFGVDARRLAVAGRGEADPIAPNTVPEGRERNRRVEIHIRPLT